MRFPNTSQNQLAPSAWFHIYITVQVFDLKSDGRMSRMNGVIMCRSQSNLVPRIARDLHEPFQERGMLTDRLYALHPPTSFSVASFHFVNIRTVQVDLRDVLRPTCGAYVPCDDNIQMTSVITNIKSYNFASTCV